MNPGGMNTAGFKVCPVCTRQAPIEAGSCVGCGHVFRQTFNVPPAAGPYQPPNPTMAFLGAYPGGPMASQVTLAEMARQFNESRKVVLWTFWVGLFCLWPVWIATYLEFDKMRKVKQQIALMGVDVHWWQVAYGARDVF